MSSTSASVQARRWYWQRISAMVLALCVLLHLAGIIYAVRGGLSGAEILSRTHGNWWFGLFYGVFVLACAVHVPAGIANIVEESGWSGRGAKMISNLFGVIILLTGWRAVYAVVVA